MFRIWLLTAVVGAVISSLLVLIPDAAYAQSGGRGGSNIKGSKGSSGYCPAGTCSKQGGRWAANVKNCSAANCRK